MASVELTVEQIVDAARQLADDDRVRLIAALVEKPKGDAARHVLEQLRDQFRMEPKRQQRMSALLAKGNEGKLTPQERAELDELVDEFQQRSLDLAQAVAQSRNHAPRGRSRCS